MKKIDISIIIISFNAKELLSECLNSLSKATCSYQMEIVVVDNASTDGAPELVEDKFPDVNLIRNDQNLGFAKANNIGIVKSVGKYICLINSDAYPLEDCLEQMCNYMENHPEIGILGPKLKYPDGSLQPSCREFPTIWNSLCRALAFDILFPNSKMFGGQLMTYFSHDFLRSVDFIAGAFLMVRKAAIDQVGLLDEDFFFYGEDKDWCKRFWDKGWKIVFYPNAEAVHYGGGSTKDQVGFYIKQTHANMLFFRKHHSRIATMSYFMIELLHTIVRIFSSVLLFFIKSKRNNSKLAIEKNMSCIKWLLHGLEI